MTFVFEFANIQQINGEQLGQEYKLANGLVEILCHHFITSPGWLKMSYPTENISPVLSVLQICMFCYPLYSNHYCSHVSHQRRPC